MESRTFLGFTEETSFSTSNSSSDPNGWPNRSILNAEVLQAWLDGNLTLNAIVQQAQDSFGNYGYKMDPSAIIYGAADLKRNTHTRTP